MATATRNKNTTVSDTLAAIHTAVEAIKNDGLQHFPEAASIGDAVRQGDVYIQLIDDADVADDKLKHLFVQMSTPELQLAPGNTKGSRHCLASADGVEMWVPARTDLAVLQYAMMRHGRAVPKQFVNGSGEYAAERTEIEAAIMLAGPIMRLSKPNTVTHPEHGDWQLPCGTYRVVFQRTVDEMARIQRVID